MFCSAPGLMPTSGLDLSSNVTRLFGKSSFEIHRMRLPDADLSVVGKIKENTGEKGYKVSKFQPARWTMDSDSIICYCLKVADEALFFVLLRTFISGAS